MNGMEMATTNKKGRMMRTFFAKWPRGSFAKMAMPVSAKANRVKRRREVGGKLTATNMNVKKTTILALESNWWIGLSVLL